MDSHPQQQACCSCKKVKPLADFNIHKTDSKHGQKGMPTSKCTHCTLRIQKSRQNTRQKCIDDEDEEPAIFNPHNPALSVDQFVVLLANQGSNNKIACHTCVNTEGIIRDSKELANVIAGHVWGATGYRFRLVPSV